MKGAPKRCLLLRSFSQESSKIYSISMEGKRLRAPVSMFRPGSSTSDFYKVIKIFIEADSNQNVHLSGPHIADESDYKRSRNSQGYVYFSIAESIHQKSVLVPLQKIEFLGLKIDLVRMTLTLPQEKVKKIESEMSKTYFEPQNYWK